ncbi:retrovirus-related pol polyprotein from transposon TNT 1-94 [Tanacetum coccineum]|uniref:Retrovirus-related pol polyprotein from transposon TNT 1-94 n=1 Tax=Tanacetum coccineum TaxID=301880 RepID=A0ABQ5BFN6_9ASTR
MKSFIPNSFIYWKNIFKTYVKSKDLDLWHVIINDDFQPIQQNLETKLDEVIPFEKQSNDLKKRLTKNNEAKMVISNALPRKEYERIFMYESIDSAFARFNTIITSLKALDEGYSIKNYDRNSQNDNEIVKAKVERKSLALKAKKESSDEECSTSGSEDEEYAMAVRDFKKFFKRRGRFVRQPRNDKKTFQRSRDDKNGKSDRKCFRCGDPNHLIGECPKPPKDKNQRAFVGGSWSDSGEEDDEKVNNETCLVAQASSEVCSESSYFSDENSSIDDLVLDNEYDKLCKMSLKIITKNKRLKATRNNLEKELSVLKKKVSTLKKNKGVDLECVKCHMLKIENEKLKEEATRLNEFEKSTHCLNEMLSNQKPSGEKLGLGFNSFEASSNGTKEIKFVKAQQKASSDGGPINMGGPQSVQVSPKTIMGPPPVGTPGYEKSMSFQKSILGPRPKHIIVNNVKVPAASDNEICLGVDLEPDEWIKDSECSKHMIGNRKLFSSYKEYNGCNVIFGSNLRDNIIGKGQICNNKYRVTFSEHDIEITKDGKVIGYSQNSKAYIILNKHARKIEESLNATLDETPPPFKTSPLVDDNLDEEAIKVTEKKNLENDIEDESLEIDEIVNIKESMNHPLENVIGNLNQRTLRSQAQNQSNFFYFISTIEPKNVNEALGDEIWIAVMQEELNQFIDNDVWELVPQPRNMTIIGTKWVFRNKLDENGIVSRNKARLVAQGYNQQEGIDYDITYALVARLESIRILLAYACALDFKLFQMDVKSAFLNGFINEEVYVAQPPGFIDFEKPDHVYKLKKALYGLKQAPKAWHYALRIMTALAISSTKAKYVSAGKACQQALWMKQAFIDYDILIMCDNKDAIDLSKNPVQHSRNKHIKIRHHFLRDNVQKGHISIKKVPSVENIADILAKPLKRESFNYLRLGLGMMEHIP